MNSTRKHLTLLITVTFLTVAMTPTTGSDAQTTPTPPKVRYNGKIVFISDRHYRGLSVWSMNPDGSSPTRLTDDKSRTENLPSFSPVYDSSPVWSPDGTKIAFISNRNYTFALYVMNADGSNAQHVAEVLEPGEPAWSPHGDKIAFSAGMRGTFFEPNKLYTDIYIVNVDGSGLTQLTRDSGRNGSPTWSPDGKQIAFTSNRDTDGKAKIWVMNADGSNQREIPNSNIDKGSTFPNIQLAWSPDGTKILFTHYRACPGDLEVAIHVMNADGNNTRLLTNDPNSCGVYSSPRWSPDGTKIVTSFSPHARNDNTHAKQIIVMNADGGNPINISNRGQFHTGQSTFTDVQADWQPLVTPLKFAPSIVGFSAPSYTVNDDAGKVEITVTRTGNLNDVASCFYVTLTEGMPIKHSDPAATGMLRFAVGESSKRFSIAVGPHNSALYKIVLSDNEGNATFVGGIKEASLQILRRRGL